MKLEKMQKLFDKYSDDDMEFEKVENKLNSRPDLHAFLLLDSLIPGDSDMVSAASHDQIWLDVDAEKLAKVITEAQVKELRQCGVFMEDDSLSMFA